MFFFIFYTSFHLGGWGRFFSHYCLEAVFLSFYSPAVGIHDLEAVALLSCSFYFSIFMGIWLSFQLSMSVCLVSFPVLCFYIHIYLKLGSFHLCSIYIFSLLVPSVWFSFFPYLFLSPTFHIHLLLCVVFSILSLFPLFTRVLTGSICILVSHLLYSISL